MAFFGLFWFLLGVLVHMESSSLAGLPVVYKTWVTELCLLLDTHFSAEVGGGITFVTSRENTPKFLKLPTSILGKMWDS